MNKLSVGGLFLGLILILHSYCMEKFAFNDYSDNSIFSRELSQGTFSMKVNNATNDQKKVLKCICNPLQFCEKISSTYFSQNALFSLIYTISSTDKVDHKALEENALGVWIIANLIYAVEHLDGTSTIIKDHNNKKCFKWLIKNGARSFFLYSVLKRCASTFLLLNFSNIPDENASDEIWGDWLNKGLSKPGFKENLFETVTDKLIELIKEQNCVTNKK